jgi:hypothetical protein
MDFSLVHFAFLIVHMEIKLDFTRFLFGFPLVYSWVRADTNELPFLF